jgi:hypothetical protein
MSQLTACQPGWLAIFENAHGDGFSTEPIACWLLSNDDEDVRPICALGGDMTDASQAKNFIGVAGPGTAAKAVYEAMRALPVKKAT